MADLAALKLRAAEAGLFTDFDGCLAPIVAEPSDATALPGAAQVLSALAGRFKVVAVVSGRAARDLAAKVQAPGVHLVGLHGMEEIVDGAVAVSPEAELERTHVEAAHASLQVELRGVRGAILEHKGLALAVHFRRASDPADAEVLATPIVERVAREHGLVVVRGRRILEVRPAAGGDKGRAVRTLIARHGLRAGLYAGDDVGDRPAFAALNELELSVRVAVDSDEAPKDLLDQADVVLDDPAELLRLFRNLAS